MTLLEPNRDVPPPEPATPKSGAMRSRLLMAVPLALLLLAAATFPFWAPRATRLLPWGPQPVTAARPVDAAIRALERRLDADETELKRQAARLAQLRDIEGTMTDQQARLSRLETRAVAPAASAPAAPAASGQGRESAASLKTVEDQIGNLTAGQSAAGDRLSKLEANLKTAHAASPPAPDQGPESTAVRTLTEQIQQLTAGHNATSDRLGKLEANVQTALAAGSAQRARLVALANLRIAAEGSGPFTAELAAAEALAGGDAAMKDALQSLGDSAKSGLPTTAALAERFDRSVAPAILRSPRDDANASWWQQMRSRIAQLVVIRRIGPGGAAPHDAAEAAVMNADAALSSGDLAAAVAALEALPLNQANAAAPWLARAKQRLTAETTLATLWRNEAARSDAPRSGNNP